MSQSLGTLRHGARLCAAVALQFFAFQPGWSQMDQEQARITKPNVPGPPYRLSDIRDELVIGKVDNDSVIPGRNQARVYRFRYSSSVTEETGVQIDATSDEIDTYLRVYLPGSREPVLENDSGAGAQNARIIIPPNLLKEQLVVVVTGEYGGHGRFGLSAAETKAPLMPKPLSLNSRQIMGTLTPDSPRRDGANFPYAQYTLKGTTGQRIRIDLISTDFDPALEIFRGSKQIGIDRDSGDGVDARLVRTLDADGEYTVYVASYSSELGAFTISADLLPKPPVLPAPPPPALSTNGTTTGVLDETSAVIRDRAFTLYEISGKKGQSFDVTLQGEPVATRRANRNEKLGNLPVMRVESGLYTDVGFGVVSWNTDQPAKIRVNFSNTGEALIRVIGELDYWGPFDLTVTPITTAPTAAPAVAAD